MLNMAIILFVIGLVLDAAAGVGPDYDVDYYPEPNYELEFLVNAAHAEHLPYHDEYPDIPDHEPPPQIPEDEPHPELVQGHWEHRLGDTVEGGYTVQEPDGTVHHVRYTENRRGPGGRNSDSAGYQADTYTPETET